MDPKIDSGGDELLDQHNSVRPGHDELFVSLLTNNHSRILSYIRTLVPQQQDAEDVFQQVSVTLWQEFNKFDQTCDFFPWAAKVAFYGVCNYRRTKYRDRLVFSEELTALMAQEREQGLSQHGGRVDMLVDCMQRLKAEDQHLLLQAYGNSFSVKDLARQSGKAAQTLYNRLTTLRRELVHCVQRKSQVHQELANRAVI